MITSHRDRPPLILPPLPPKRDWTSHALAFVLGFSFVWMAHLAYDAYHLATWPGLPT